MVWLWANITTGHVAKTGKPDLKPAKPRALYDEAKKRGWVVVSMKDDWKRLFPFDQ
ncbi:MAG: hypothetical protein WBQ11_09175 [Isosphaeraceae bacterium]